MEQKTLKQNVWKVMVKRYLVASGIGLVICIYFFWRMYRLPLDSVTPLWFMWCAGLGGIMFLGGLFGVGMSCFLHMISKEG